MNRITKTLAGLLFILPFSSWGQEIVEISPGLERSPSPPGATVSFAKLKDGDVVPKSFAVNFRIKGMKVRPAGTQLENSGHHHLLIDVDELPPMNLPLPKNESVYHFGKGEKRAVITLTPGEHTLQLLFADYLHIPHDPPVMSEKITVTVEE
ncbi:MAG: DUF4399 domain-containing protein [Xanthomonadales bacterium]|nr:DUF4399 domain-containing protein [Xanthomonadales bacterium]